MEFRYSSRVDEYKRQITVPAMVAPSGWWSGRAKASISPENVTALIDTGANISSISPHLAKRLGIKPKSGIYINSADGTSYKKTYDVAIRFLISSSAQTEGYYHTVHDIEVAETAGDVNRIVVGMDIILSGSLHVEDNNFIFCLKS